MLKAGNLEDANRLLVQATDADPEAQYLDALGRTLEARWKKSNDGKFIESARAAYERAAKADPKLFPAMAGQGRMLVALRNWEQAINVLKEAAKLDPTNSDVMLSMALAYYGMRNSGKDYKKTSAQWFESALKAHPEVPLKERADAWNKLTTLYEDADINKIRDAIRAHENAIHAGEQIEKEFGATASPPWLTDSYYYLGDLYYRTNNPAAQKKMFLKYVDRNPPKSERLKRVNNDLATSLQRY
jgi:tetratricopeptide (TPR) repeat protein